MPSWKTLFKSDNFISAVELENKKPTLTINRIQSVKLEQEDGREKDKPVIFFKEIQRGWVFCKTTGHCLSAMFGEDYNGWVGKRVTLHAEPVQVGRETQPGIRVTGSPDIDKPLTVKIKLPKKKAFIVKLIQTIAKGSPELKDPQPTIDKPAEQNQPQEA
jgi:hypothetical protein